MHGPFARFYVIDSKSFCNFMEARDSWVTEQDLETFEREGFLPPLFRLRRRRSPGGGLKGFSTLPGILRSCLDEGLLEFPVLGDFKPWSSFEEGFDRSVYIFYHSAQALLIDKFLHVINIPVTGLHRRDINWEDAGPQLTKRYELLKRAYLSSVSAIEKRISLIIRLETPYTPLYWERFKIGPLRDAELENWRTWKQKEFNPTGLLAASGLSLNEIKGWRDALALEAIHFDPIGNWYMLVRLINYNKKSHLRGNALRAQDYYEYVSLLNLFLEELTGEQQPEPDAIADSSDGSWKKVIYGENFDLDNPETQKRILGEYSRYGERMLTKLYLVVEGASEEARIPLLCHELLWAFEADAQLINLDGSGNLNRLEPLLESAKRDNVKVHLIVDPHMGVRETVEDLVRARLLEGDGFKIWQRDFEEDNFSEEDILAAVNKLLRDRKYPVTREDLQSLSVGGKTALEGLLQVVRKKYEERLWDLLSKRTLALTLIEPRLKEIHKEVADGRYVPKLELEKVLIQVSKRISFTHLLLHRP